MSQTPKISRRALLERGLNAGLGAGFAAVGLGALHLAGQPGGRRVAHASSAMPTPGMSARVGPSPGPSPGLGHPILDLGGPGGLRSRMVGGLPFAEEWTGDGFPGDAIPFHQCENCFPNGAPPVPTQRVEVAVIGGGLSGLASAHMLRDRDVVLMEMRDRTGGAAMGERWLGAAHSLGSAYFIVPDERSSLEALYRELGVWPDVAVDDGGLAAQLHDEIVLDVLKWQGYSDDERARVERYAEVVAQMLDAYPEIPLSKDSEEAAAVLELDVTSFHDDVHARVGGPLPKPLAAAIQAYFHSSFGVGWEEISAAAGWNFVAAEEIGRIVLPGGNAGLAAALHASLVSAEVQHGRAILKPDHMVVDVRLHDEGVLVTWRDESAPEGFRSLIAEHAIVATPKYVAKWLLHDLVKIDPDKYDAMAGVNTCAYVVANVLLDHPVTLPTYDLFLLGDGSYPMNAEAAAQDSRVADVLDGGFGVGGGDGGAHGGSTALTLYWPLPWPAARFTIIGPGVWDDYATRLAPQVRKILGDLGIGSERVVQIRMSRWGHAMPISRIGAIAEGLPERLRRPIGDRIWFVNQDNWLLPAVETCLLEAEEFTGRIRELLR